MAPRKISIIVPCYNEVHTIEETLRQLLTTLMPGWEKEIIVVDDASVDGTRDILKRYEDQMQIMYCEKNGGKGTALHRGIAYATGTHIIIQDADLEYDPTDIPSLLSAIDGGTAEVVYGSRNLNPRAQHGGLIPRLGVWFITKLINTLYGLSLTDVWTCYKLFPHEAAGEFLAGRFESELLFTAALVRRGYRFAEVPITYAPRDVAAGKKIRYRDGFYAILVICIDWARHV